MGLFPHQTLLLIYSFWGHSQSTLRTFLLFLTTHLPLVTQKYISLVNIPTVGSSNEGTQNLDLFENGRMD